MRGRGMIAEQAKGGEERLRACKSLASLLCWTDELFGHRLLDVSRRERLERQWYCCSRERGDSRGSGYAISKGAFNSRPDGTQPHLEPVWTPLL